VKLQALLGLKHWFEVRKEVFKLKLQKVSKLGCFEDFLAEIFCVGKPNEPSWRPQR
jgi:hypothetical protein